MLLLVVLLHWSWSNKYIDTITHRQCHTGSNSSHTQDNRTGTLKIYQKLNRLMALVWCVLKNFECGTRTNKRRFLFDENILCTCNSFIAMIKEHATTCDYVSHKNFKRVWNSIRFTLYTIGCVATLNKFGYWFGRKYVWSEKTIRVEVVLNLRGKGHAIEITTNDNRRILFFFLITFEIYKA